MNALADVSVDLYYALTTPFLTLRRLEAFL
jgi:hypothetical protein